VIHRDVKPANLLVDGRGNLWVTDFGLARLQHDAGLTASGDLVGTVRYMSPEQAQSGGKPVDHRTDVYALGATLYELLTLQPAFPGDDRRELLRRILLEEPRRPRRVNAAVPADLEAVVLKAMEKVPAERYGSAQELADDLRRFLADEPVRARHPSMWRSAAKWAMRHAAMVAIAAAAVAVVAVTLGVTVALLSVRNKELSEQRTRLDEALGSANERAEQLKQEQAARNQALQEAKQAGKLARQGLQGVLLQLADERLKLDPHWTATAKGLLDRGVGVYEELNRLQGKDPQVRNEVAWALRQAASVYARLGEDEPARKTYGRALDLGQQLVKDFPQQWAYRFLLASTYRELGDLHRTMARRTEAVAAYQDSLDAWSRPTTVPACPIEGSLAHDGLGTICEQLPGKEAEAAEHYRRAITHREPFAQAQPDVPYHRLCLAYWHRKLGLLVSTPGTEGQAGEHLRRAYDLMTGVVKQCKPDDNNVKMYQSELVDCCNALGDLQAENDPAAAAKYYGQARDLLAALVHDTPGEPSFRLELAQTHSRLGSLARLTKRPAEAAEHYGNAQALLTALAADVPGGRPGPGAPGSNDNALAWFLATCPDESFRNAGRAVEYALKAVARAPQRGDYYGTLGAAYYRAGQPDKAVEVLEKGRKLPQGGEGADLFFLAMAYGKQGNHERALACHRSALEWTRRHRGGDPAMLFVRDEAGALLGKAVAETPRRN
jgi:tetratricopeptide (TPR) repeat protein